MSRSSSSLLWPSSGSFAENSDGKVSWPAPSPSGDGAYDNDGQILTVKYQMLAPMLLNEVQKQNAQLPAQQEENRKLEDQNRQQTGQIRSLTDRLAAVEALLSGQQ